MKIKFTQKFPYLQYFSFESFTADSVDFLILLCDLLIYFSNQLLRKILSECQTVWIQTRPDTLLGLIWDQAVCYGYLQMTLVGNELFFNIFTSFRYEFLG